MRRTLWILTFVLLLTSGVVKTSFAQSNGNLNGKRAASGTTVAAPAPLKVSLPLKDGSVRFAAIGDTGTGSAKQHELAEIMIRSHQSFPFEFVLLMGDNMYGGESPADYRAKFFDVYQALLAREVKFYASLGNHDEPAQRLYEHFNMDGKEYYRFTKGNVAFYALNSNYMDKKQLDWLQKELGKDTSRWKIAFCHHPPYSSGKKHGSDTELREVLEPIFVRYGVDAVLAGHDHFYERVKPQKGVFYFVSGAGAKLRSGDVRRDSPLTAKAYDRDLSFMLIEITDEAMYLQVLNRVGETVDAAVLPKRK